MDSNYKSNIKVKSELLPILKGNPSREAVKSFVNLCHKIATAYIKVKIINKIFFPNKFGLSSEDIAIDSIADLFKIDTNGNFLEIKNYFQKYEPIENQKEEIL